LGLEEEDMEPPRETIAALVFMPLIAMPLEFAIPLILPTLE